MRRSLSLLFATVLAVGMGSVALVTSLSLAQPVENRPITATYVHGVLHFAIKDNAPRMGEGNLTLEILDPEDGVAARIDRPAYASAGRGLWRQELALPESLPFDDLVWHRVRYRFTYKGDQAVSQEGIASISKILRLPAVHICGQQSYLSGSSAAVRLIVTEQDSETPVSAGTVEIQLLGARQPQVLYTGKLNERGTTQAHFRVPEGLAGSYSLRYALDTEIGPAEYTQQIRVEDKTSILLTTEKPIYQPGQTIHVRALALDRANHQATSGRKLAFEVEDSRGNKVFRQITQTDPYGVASAEFGLADEVNLGTYHLRALMEDSAGSATATAENALQVERYVLPRFKVAVELAGKDSRIKRGYRPGDHVTGTVRAHYFFGKAVDGAEVTVRASGVDVERFEAGSSQGRTGRDGIFAFDLRLPEYFAGTSSNQAAVVMLEATVKDTSGHSESHVEAVTISTSPLLITAVPESGFLVPGLENQIFVVASYPDGTPSEAEIRVHAPGIAVQSVTTDSAGIATVTLRAEAATSLRIDASDREGNHTSVRVPLQSRIGADQILLRADRGVYRAGEPVRLQVFSTRQSGSAYIDAIKNGQTIHTYDAAIVGGCAELTLTATPDMAGTVEFHAYLFGREGRPVADHRLIFVQPAEELRIQTELDQHVYKPGGEAHIGFRVMNSRGEGVPAALGLEIVDEAVFALAQKQPGFAKAFFYLEQELMTPRYEIHSVTLPQVISSADPADSKGRDLAARALFAAAEQLTPPSNASAEFGSAAPRNKYPEYATRYQTRLREDIDEAGSIPASPSGVNPQPCDRSVLASRLQEAKLLDPWGNSLRVETGNPGTNTFAVRSAGPDGRFQTADDLVQYREDRYCTEPAAWGSGTVKLRLEDSGDPPSAAAEITGYVADPTGAAIPRARIRLIEGLSGTIRETTTDDHGRFGLSGLIAGSFQIQILSPGFQSASRRFSLYRGDRAVLSVTLEVGAVTETVEVTASASAIMTESAVMTGREAKTVTSARKKDGPAPESQEISKETHIRSWFPEALYIRPEIITDGQGRASITVPIADNITTWRMATLASTKQGSLGSGTSSLKVFQDFFTELDLPVTLTQGDRVSLPVAIYNYTGSPGQVRLGIAQEDWFSFGDTAEKSIAVEPDRVAGSQFTIEARRIGKFKLTLMAQMDGAAKRQDVVVREIEVVPNGREETTAFNGKLESAIEHTVAFPPDAIADAGTIFVRLYPGPLSQVVEGMDAILHMPSGCFEQTSSTTYPNVLALDYMKRTKKLTTEIHAKAEGFIAKGYQRLLTFEVQGGGFSWFGNAPANKILTSYGLMEFNDMSKVHEIDRRIIERTQQWLAQQQQADGSWKPDTNFISEGATGRYKTDALRITAYIAWALESTGYHGPELERARRFIYGNRTGKPDSYTLAVLANFAVEPGTDRTFTQQAIQQLLDARIEKDEQAWWTADETGVYGGGASASAETTGLAVQALLKSGESPAIARRALNYLAARKDAYGTWGSTQATIMALKALLLSAEKGSGDARGTVEITLNGQPAGRLTIGPENGDLFHQVVLKPADFSGSNRVALRFQGEGGLAYQIAGRYFVPWTANSATDPLSIDVSYDRTRLAQGDIVSATATVRSHLPAVANMVMVELGIPPGFDLLSEDLDNYRTKSAERKTGRLEKYNLTATQAVLYFDSIAPGAAVTVRYRLRAKYPVQARTFRSRVYEYYDPAVSSMARPVQIEVRAR